MMAIETSVAALRAALSSALAGALGGFAGGLIMSRLRLGPVGAVRLIIITTCTLIVGIVVFLFLGCPQINMAGQLDQDSGRSATYLQCSICRTRTKEI